MISIRITVSSVKTHLKVSHFFQEYGNYFCYKFISSPRLYEKL